ncbi:MAG: hypothetical protein KDB29_16015, partial [Planctomycetes bacterium]|nr:hypothetical protein [Planctomycetota bacterium]
MSSGQLPVGPWTSLGSTGGGHNGPSFNYVLDYWVPSGIGDALHWRGTSTADLAQGQLLWSNIAGTLNGATSANFVAATRVAPGITVDAVAGTASSVFNNETGGGNGYQAGTFQILNNGTAAETVTDITVEGLGTGDHTSVYSSFQIYEDVTGSGSVGSYDTGDTLIGTGSFAGGPPSTTISVPAAQQNFAAATSKRYFLVVQLNGTAITAQTLDYRITGVTVGGSSTVFNTPSREFHGLVIDGPRVDVAATAGTSQPVLNNEDGGGNGFEAGTFNVTATATAAVTVTSLTIRGLGTGDHTADYTEFAVYRDQTGSGSVGSYDTGDALIATGTFSGSPTEVNIPFSGGEQNFAASETKQYFIVIKLGGTASVTETFNYQVVAGTAAGTAAVLSVPTATINGVTIIAPEVTFDGATPPVNPVVIPGASDQPVLAFDLSASNVSVQDISSIALTKTGTIADSDITEVKLWDDTNGNGLVDTGESQVGSTQTYSGGTLSFSGSPLISLAVNQSKSYVVTYTLSGSVTSSTTFGVTLNPVSDINATPGPVRVTTAVPTGTQLVFLISSFPYVQNFDAFPYSGYTPNDPHPLVQGWYNDLADGGYDWMVYRNSTPYGGTGPSADHTTGTSSGQYLYVPDASVNSSTSPVNLITPPMDISGLTL